MLEAWGSIFDFSFGFGFGSAPAGKAIFECSGHLLQQV
jgi:hypothetical protein